ncbi:MAG TPA: hypothetical protein VJ183_14025 [Chloroflexia bacterium]|nr:hypothetical protein [Chloroflexia bacterium]
MLATRRSPLRARSSPDFDKGWQTWYWAAVPLLAFIAYATVLRIGFLGDDYLLLGLASEPGADLQAFLPGSRWLFYRPVGVFFTWELGWQLWGYNPLPYHLAQLLMHAATSLLLGLWLSYITGRRLLGLLAGLIFAAFPTHGEAVGWLASQWDVLSAMLGIGGMWCFTIWWRDHTSHIEGTGPVGRRGWRLYLAALFLYTLAAFTKESIFTFVLMLGISAWFVAPPREWAMWRKLGFALLPFGAVVVGNIALRLIMVGELGTYPFARSDYGEFIWDSFLSYMRFFLAPFNPALWGNTWVQIAGLASTLLLLLGLARYGRSQARLLTVAALWVILALTPVLNLPVTGRDDFRDTRFLYLPSIGYCTILAVLLYEALTSIRRWRPVLVAGLSILAAVSAAVCWVQVSPWRIATAQTNEIVEELLDAIPPQPRPNGLVWLVENIPERYKGALMLNWGLGLSRVFTDREADYPRVERVPEATQALVASEKRDAYAIRFSYVENSISEDRWTISYLAGVTGMSPPPTAIEDGENAIVWDFRGCSPDVLESWPVSQARASCEPGRGLILEPGNDDPQMEGPPIDLSLSGDNPGFVRLRVGMRYLVGAPALRYVGEWFWKGRDTDYSQERHMTIPIREDGQHHIYWTFLPAEEVGQSLTGLRFDPVNAQITSEIEWIAVDLVK